MKNIAIIGSGSWGVALATHLARLGHNIKCWSYTPDVTDDLNINRRSKYLPGLIIPENVHAYNSYKETIDGTEIILHTTPSRAVRENVREYKKYVANQPVIMCSKGFEKETSLTLIDVLKEELKDTKLAALSGPSHAEEVSVGIPTAIVIASEHEDVLDLIQSTFMSPKLRIYTSKDIKGVELGGALKNIIAFCAGVTAGMNMGDNTFAALITRGLVEISNLGTTLGGEQATFYGLTGLGDLIVTCMSEHSRNRKAGILIGEGKTIEETKKEVGMTIESIDNIEVAYKLCKKYDLEMPIVETVYNVLFNNLDPKDAVNILMTRSKKSE